MIEISTLGAPERRQLAARAIDALADPGERVLLQVRCNRGHHVAAVFDTDAGPVFRSRPGSHAHGSRDFVDAAHGAHQHGTPYFDLLAASANVENGLPASCECGPATLSRAMLQQAVDQWKRTIHLP